MTTPQDSTPTPDPDPLRATVPGFRAPPSTPGPDPLDPTASTITTPSATSTTSTGAEDGAGSSNGPGPDGPHAGEPLSNGPTKSSRASTPDPLAFVEIARTLVALVSMAVAAARRRRRPHMPPAAWIATPVDQAAIGDPLARIAARHAPIGDGDEANDVIDGLTAMVGAAGYVVGGVQAEALIEVPDAIDVDVVDGPTPGPGPADGTGRAWP